MDVELKVEVPETAFSALKRDRAGFGREMRLAAAVKWYEAGQLSQEKAAEIAAGLSRATFILELARFQTTPVQYSIDELKEELAAC